MKPTGKELILQQIAAISVMERGKISAYSFKDRSPAAGPYHKLQYWQDGRNHTRYVSAEELPAVEAALAGHARFEQLTGQYADLVVAETRQNLVGLKKKPARRNSAWPRTRKSSG